MAVHKRRTGPIAFRGLPVHLGQVPQVRSGHFVDGVDRGRRDTRARIHEDETQYLKLLASRVLLFLLPERKRGTAVTTLNSNATNILCTIINGLVSIGGGMPISLALVPFYGLARK